MHLIDLMKTWTWEDGRRKTSLTTVTYKGRAAWIGVQLGEALEYRPPTEFVKQIRDEWADEFSEGTDFDLLRGPELAEFKKLVSETGTGGRSPLDLSAFKSGLMLVYESGLWAALMLTKKPVGKRLRLWLKATVLPEIAATGGYVSGATPEQAEALVARLVAKQLAPYQDATTQKINLLESGVVEGRQQTGQALTLASRATEDAAVMTRVVQHLSDRLGAGAYEDGRIGERQAGKIKYLIGEVAAGRCVAWQSVNVELRERENLPQAMRWEDVPVTHMASIFTWLERQIEKYPRPRGGGQGDFGL